MKNLPSKCPSCGEKLKVKSLKCICLTEIQGDFELPVLAGLHSDDQQFILNFLKTSGSLKEMAKLMGLSYPTVRNRLDDIIEKIKIAQTMENNSKSD